MGFKKHRTLESIDDGVWALGYLICKEMNLIPARSMALKERILLKREITGTLLGGKFRIEWEFDGNDENGSTKLV